MITDTPIIQARNLRKSFTDSSGLTEVLQGVDLTVYAGQTVALIGASGSGKSTLLALLAALDHATSGELDVLGQTVHTLSEESRAALRCGQLGFIFQNFQLIPYLSALENVQISLELAQSILPAAEKLTHKAIQARAMAALEQVGLSSRAHHTARILSGGEQQRVAIARASVCQPKLIFADEPTGSLDHVTGQKIEALLFDRVREQGATLVLVTHDEALASRCDVQYRVVAGKLSLA